MFFPLVVKKAYLYSFALNSPVQLNHQNISTIGQNKETQTGLGLSDSYLAKGQTLQYQIGSVLV